MDKEKRTRRRIAIAFLRAIERREHTSTRPTAPGPTDYKELRALLESREGGQE